MRKRITEQEFKKELASYLSGDVPDDVREMVEKLEMRLASPGDWDRVKKESEQGENDKGQISQWLENLLERVRNRDEAGVKKALADGWPSQWDADIDDMTYEGREGDPAMLRKIVDTFRGLGSNPPTAQQLSAALQTLTTEKAEISD